MPVVFSQGSFSRETIKTEENTIRIISIEVKYLQIMLCLSA